MVDTCAGEFKAETPYFYSTLMKKMKQKQFIERTDTGKKKVIVFGSGPIRIGQGIEFDYCSVHCVWSLKEEGYEAVICNNNLKQFPLTSIQVTDCILIRLQRGR